MRDLFGNPPDGSFLAWLADKGVWAALIVIGALAVWYIAHRLMEAWISRTLKRMESNWLLGHAVRQEAVFRWLDEIIIAVLIGTPTVIGLLDVLGVDIAPALDRAGDWWTASSKPWLTDHGVKILLILVVGWVARAVLGRAVPRLLTGVILRSQAEDEAPEEAQRRADTLSGVLGGAVTILIFLVVLLTVLQELNVPIGPLIGSLGLAGVAVGFGSQWFVRDVIAGAFIIGENQYRKGDVVEVAGVAGLVESINLRRTILRDLDGKFHIVPNGEIKVASNFSRKWARVNLDVQVAYKHNMDHVLNVLREIGEEMAKDPNWSEMVLEAPKPIGVENFGESGISIKVLAMTKPLKNWDVRRELLYRIKKRFDEEGIEIPFPHRTLYWGDSAHPQTGRAGSADAAEQLQSLLRQKAAQAAERRPRRGSTP